MKSITYLADCFLTLDPEEKVEISSVTEHPYFFQVRVKNVAQTNATVTGLQKFFGHLPVRCLNVPNSNEVDIQISKIKMPSRGFHLDQFARFMQKELTTEHKDHWFLGLSDFGPQFFNLQRLTHLGLFGSSGFGKSSLFRFLLGQSLRFQPNAVHFIIDPKKVDYSAFKAHPQVKAIAQSYNDWASIVTSLVTECAFREKVFSEAFESSPTSLKEYSQMREQFKRTDLPDFPKTFVWIDEAHAVFNDSAESPAYNGLVYLARKARSFGIHLIFSSQRQADIPTTIRNQVAQSFYFYTTENFVVSEQNFPLDKMQAIPGRLYFVDTEDRTLTVAQAPYMNNDESVGLAYHEMVDKKHPPVSSLKLHADWLTNGHIVNFIYQGYSLQNLNEVDPAKIKDYKNFRKNYDFSFSYEKWYKTFSTTTTDLDSLTIKNQPKGPIDPDELLREFDELLKGSHNPSPARATTPVKPVTPAPVVAAQPATTTAKPLAAEIPNYPTTANFLDFKKLVQIFSAQLEQAAQDFQWCTRDISNNPGLLAAQFAMQGSFQKRSYVHSLKELALGEKQRTLLSGYTKILAQALGDNTKAPLLIVSGKEGFGKQTLIEALCKTSKLPLINGKLSDLVKLNATKNEKSAEKTVETKKAYVFHDPEEALEFYNHSGPQEVVFLSYVEPENDPFSFVLMQAPYDFTYVKENHVLIRLDERMYAVPEVFEKLIMTVLKKHDYKGTLVQPMPLFASAGVRPIPSQVEAVINRASTRALFSQKIFDETFLVQTLQFLELSRNKDYTEVQIIHPEKTREDLILHEDTDKDLADVIHRAQNFGNNKFKFTQQLRRSPRMVALFAGEPGTGKSMAAEVIAKAAGKDLWICDFSKILGMFVGETEKTLTRIFNAAKAAGCVLLLDECDSLLTNRAEASKFERGVVNHLLMLVENFQGILIMTTNFAENLDPAFSRRIDVKAHFKLPSENQMVQILNRLLQPDAPLAADYNPEQVVAGLRLSGGLIRNAVERALIKMERTESAYLTNEILRQAFVETYEENQIVVKQERRVGIAS